MTDDILNFILMNEGADTRALVLNHKEILGYPTTFVINQINGRRRSKEKLPTWYAIPSIVYPPQANLQQCSSEATAQFKCDVISRAKTPNRSRTETLADLTGGFGVDSFFFSQIFQSVYHVEPNIELCQLAKKNHEQLGVKNIFYDQSSAEVFISQTNQKFDWIYLDPSRKSKGRKIVKLTDSQPNVVEVLPTLFSKAENILIKTSPLMDLKEGIRQLPNTKNIHVISVDNECKEVLFQLQRGFESEPEIFCTNLTNKAQETFRFRFSEEVKTESHFGDPDAFVYEPNASILKAGAFKTIAKGYGLSKISGNTHLYTSSSCLVEFPGRVFKIVSPFDAMTLSLEARPPYFNIISRNHPLNTDEIKKKFKLKDGGENYLLAFSGLKKNYMLVAKRVGRD